jgi:Heterokaryon incompatibility protein (HET)
MDHLPRPSAANRLGEELRQPGTKVIRNLHDGISRVAFEEYPLRRGFSSADLGAGNFLPEQSHQAAALVQNWLFFGLLEEVFRVSVPATDFTATTDDGEHFLSTRLLSEYVGRWKERVEQCIEEERAERAEWAARLREVFREVARFFQLHLSGPSAGYPDDFAIYLNPLAVLLETLQHYTSNILADGAEHEPLPTNFSSQATQELIQRGWCPFTIANILLPSSSPSLFEYARRFRDHPSFIHQDHAACNASECAVSNVDTSTYKTKHNDVFCKGEHDCETLTPNMEIVKAKLEGGKMPVVSFAENQGLVTLGTEDGPYVAISHVWADGMGSTSEQGIPICVVKFLSEAATASFNSTHDTELDAIPFWIDSLCVPSQTDLRGKAIGLMAKTYASAAAVVVIDASMLHLSVSDPIQEQLFVLYVSSWVQRLWTLPEALLSRQLLFRASDRLIDFRYFFTDEVVKLRLNDVVASKLLGWIGQLMIGPFIRSAQAATSSSLSLPPHSLDDIVLHLSKRTSSRQEDETLAIAGLFGQDASEYIPLDPDQRMAKFLTEHNGGKVPYDILFLDGPKLPIENYTWAPKSFMKRQLNAELKGTFAGAISVITQQGLLGQYFCLVLQLEWGADGPPWTYRVQINNGEHLVVLFDRSVDSDEEGVPEYNVLLLHQWIEKGEEFLAACGQLLGSVEAEEDSVLRVELACYVHVFNEDRNETWNKLPVANSATGSTRFVLVS